MQRLGGCVVDVRPALIPGIADMGQPFRSASACAFAHPAGDWIPRLTSPRVVGFPDTVKAFRAAIGRCWPRANHHADMPCF